MRKKEGRQLRILIFVHFIAILFFQKEVIAQDELKANFEVVKINSTDSVYHQIYLRTDSLVFKVISKKQVVLNRRKCLKLTVGKVYPLELFTVFDFWGMKPMLDNIGYFDGIELEDSCVHNLYYVKKMIDLYIKVE